MSGEKRPQLVPGIRKLIIADAIKGSNDRPLAKLQRRITGVTARHFKIPAGFQLPQHAVAIDSVREDHDGLAWRKIFVVKRVTEKSRYVKRRYPKAC